jgi:hypothetical protein
VRDKALKRATTVNTSRVTSLKATISRAAAAKATLRATTAKSYHCKRWGGADLRRSGHWSN